ncbi:metallophosphoesterase family protein [Tuwongella immobilis]|uniref:Calcineurin-like phosphoesterase domain-containing protein n=1 Tax=Tuwongella immobilis TaxID=692036 RepID=A0A6C2YP81_9BACT|nr:metallophosphoesterase [Tuwongella immobilis]VIP02855.1 metallophosphoesterase : Metallophosphoesterase OS=Niastella koreensis (strain DSM 17620 / KACC 11465 / GR20-10) GN=Niako_4187 PE=4 SV=1: Metallophos [Tuwongella immobilis]VTS02653.1 metallophosphoesterase : Metallophosphoesterase OS=Niastella koreensis (strain DSM 17620 / KACC 11465 / GR20-10) GN=Niako_4187 PE=4 SV=1: Metallophos [Tuwongella immobilis]
MNPSALDRRKLLLLGAATPLISPALLSGNPGQAKPVLRAAHITDVHLTPGRNAADGFTAALKHMQSQPDWSPELILNTGDSMMAVDGGVPAESAKKQIDLWQSVTQKQTKLPIRSILGNHDIWGGKQPTEQIPESKKGPKLIQEALQIPSPWYSFDLAGWHFIGLSSAWPNNGTLGDEQFAWLQADLAATPTTRPVCVLSHYPILSVTSQTYGDSCRRGNDQLLPGNWTHADCWAITELFRQHPNVKLSLSGHMHTCDRCEYRGVWYICGGAVSGAWWEGAEYGFPPMYGQIDFYADGAFAYRFTDYGWTARQWKGKQLSATTKPTK